MPADSGCVGLFTVQPTGPQPYSCTPERGVKVSRWVLATPQLLVGFATDNNWCGSRFSGQWSQQGWLKDHRGLCLDKGTADMVCCGCANILGSPTILGQLGTGQQGKSDSVVSFRSKPHTLGQESHQCWWGEMSGDL